VTVPIFAVAWGPPVWIWKYVYHGRPNCDCTYLGFRGTVR